MAPLHNGPAIVPPAWVGRGLEIHFLVQVLAHIGDVQVAGQPVEAVAPGIAQAQGPDLVTHAGIADKGVVCRDGVGIAAVHVDAQHGAQQRRAILAIAELVASRAAVAGTDVQVAVRAKGQVAAVVVAGRLVQLEQGDLAAGIGDRQAARLPSGRHGEVGNHRIALSIGVVDVKQTILGKGGVKGQAEQALLVLVRAHTADNVEQGGSQQRSIFQHPDAAGLFHDKEPPAAVTRVGQSHRHVQAASDALQLEAQAGDALRGGRRWGRRLRAGRWHQSGRWRWRGRGLHRCGGRNGCCSPGRFG